MNDYERIARIIRYLDEHHDEQPDLPTLADHAGLSSSHFHRLFAAWAGVTPKNFLQCLTLAHARHLLANGSSVLDAALGAGLSSPGRLHDLCVTLEAATPGEIKSGGGDFLIKAGIADTPFGTALIATTPRGICHLAFIPPDDFTVSWKEIASRWHGATIERCDQTATELASRIFSPNPTDKPGAPLKAHVCGTAFQLRVWRALIAIPDGALLSYGKLAKAIKHPNATRAVGTAVGRNPIAYLIPCHRVIRETGIIGNYRWGQTRKRAILAWESCRTSTRPSSRTR